MTAAGPSSRGSEPRGSLGAALRAGAPPVAAITVFGLSIAMSHPLLALLLERMDASGFWIGVNTTAAAVATVVLAPVLPRIVAWTGMGRLLIVSGAGLAGIMLLFPLMPDYWAWLVLRLLMGCFGAAIFFASEYWIVAAAPDGARGRAIAVYTISLSVAFLIGPLLIGWTGIEGWLPFVVAAGVMAVGLLPVIWGISAIPPADPETPPTVGATLRFFVTDPIILWGVAVFGMIEFGAVALLPVWGVRTGLSEFWAAAIMASFAGGAMVFAPALGWLADRYDRRRLLALSGLGSAVAPLAMMLTAPSLPGMIAAGILWGAAAVGLYTLALTELGARYRGARLADGNAAVVFAYGIGALVAPAALGQAMDIVPPDGLLLLSAAVSLGYAGLAVWRIAQRPEPPRAGAP